MKDAREAREQNFKAPLCPQCKSPNTVKTYDRCDLRMFFCGSCEHSWASSPEVKLPKLSRSL
jgi:ribosomal protein L37AE/L43A